ncbi:unnamed protein product [Symbiodinium sp. KB8]|nr:unnamed protein product [Symbiodinium sp. KB8]
MDEFLLFLQEHQPHVNVVCLQETHWKHTSEWLTERWICVHDHDPKHTYAGLLTLISRKLVSSEDVRTVSHVPGRVLQVRFPLAGVHVDILNCYQLPWNTRGCRQQLLERRAKIWNAVEQAVESVPQRNLLCVMGDFNAQLVPEANRVGTATCITDHTEQVAQDGPAFQGILQDLNATVLKAVAAAYPRNRLMTQLRAQRRMVQRIIDALLDQVGRCLRLIPARKATPHHCVPSIVWKISHQELAPYLQEQLRRFWSADAAQVPQLWRDAWFALLPKPSRPCKQPSDLRPIALQCSLGKAAIKLLCEEVRPYVVQFLQHTPQFAYCRGRDVQMALLRALSHFDQVRADAAEHVDKIHNRHQGRTPRAVGGAITLSLDLEQAFDRLPRSLVIRSLMAARVPAHLIHLVDVWHRNASYHLSHGGLNSQVSAQQGVRQGCLLAPLLFACATGLIVQELPSVAGPAWRDVLTIYADDFLGQEWVHTVDDIGRILQRWGTLVDCLYEFGLRLSKGKSVILARIGGSKGQAAWRKFLVKTEEGWQVRLPSVRGNMLIALKEEHKYLGAMVSYKSYEASTFQLGFPDAMQQLCTEMTGIVGHIQEQLRLDQRSHVRLVQDVVRQEAATLSRDQYSIGSLPTFRLQQLHALANVTDDVQTVIFRNRQKQEVFGYLLPVAGQKARPVDQLTTSILQTRVMEMVAQVAECIRPEVVLRLESIGRSSLANPTAQLRADQNRAIRKKSVPIAVGDMRMPTFVNASNHTELIDYKLLSMVVHHGQSPNTGHYRSALTAEGQDHFYTDDGVSAVSIDDIGTLSRDVYMLWYLKVIA